MKILRAAVVVLLALVVGGCSDDEPKPRTLPPAPTASASASASAEGVASVPPEATRDDAEGAAAFARFFMAALNEAFKSGDPTAAEPYSAPTCEGCRALLDNVEELRLAGQRSVGGDYVVTRVAAPAVLDGDVIVDIEYERTSGQILDRGGAVVEQADAVPPTDAQLRLLWREGRWVVAGYRVVPS